MKSALSVFVLRPALPDERYLTTEHYDYAI